MFNSNPSIPIGAKVEINTLDVVFNVNLEIDNQRIIVSIITLNINHRKIQQFHN
jgi:hypothetical protein